MAYAADETGRNGCRVMMLAVLALAGAFLVAASARAAPLRVTVEGIRSNGGFVAVCVFSAAPHFPDCARGARAATAARPAEAPNMRFDFDLEPGVLAVAVMHDENGNGAMDTNFLGIPREGGGVSNNPPPRRGPPLHSQAAFRLLPQGGAINVNMVYP